MDRYILEEVLALLRQRLTVPAFAETLDVMFEDVHPGARKAAVLLTLFMQDQELSLAFIRRASTLRAHGGEIALPGGGIDPTDASPVMAALREAQEEIGLDPASVDVLGLLPSVFTTVSNYLIIPVVAYLPQGLGTLSLQQSEVTELIVASLHGLASPSIAHTERWTRGSATHTVYFYDYGPYCIWGATGRILHTFLCTLGLGEAGTTEI